MNYNNTPALPEGAWDQDIRPKKDKPTALVFMKRGYEDIELFLRNNFECIIFKGDWGEPFPSITFNEEGILLPEIYHDDGLSWLDWGDIKKLDWIFSFLCPWKIPIGIINKVIKGAINFHPGPPKYPGIGCYNYAIWNEDRGYAVTMHHMAEEIDAGKIIDTKWIKLYKNDTIKTLKNRAIIELKKLFYDYMERILTGYPIDYLTHKKVWGEYKSRKDFQEFCKIHPYDFLDNMGRNDLTMVERKLRATYFKGAPDGPYINVDDKKWRLVPEDDLK